MENEKLLVDNEKKRESIRELLSEARRKPTEVVKAVKRDSESRSIYRSRSYAIRGRSGQNTRQSLHKSAQRKEKSTFYERLQTQMMAAALVLVAVLVIKLINTSFTNKIEAALASVLQQSYTWNDVKDKGADAFGLVVGLTDSVKTIFGFEKPESSPLNENEKSDIGTTDSESVDSNDVESVHIEDYEATGYPPLDNNLITPDTSISNEEEQEQNTDFRIDEDILNSIDTQEDTYLKENAEKN